MNPSKINTLVLHKVVNAKNKCSWEDISVKKFDFILENLNKHHTHYQDTENNINSNSISLTFDDGNLSDFTTVFPKLLDKSIKGVFFIIANRIGSKGYLNWPQIKEMSNHGMIIGSHGLSHKSFTDLNDFEVLDEFKKSKNILENGIGIEIRDFSYPLGDYSKITHELGFDSGYNNLFISDHGFHYDQERIIPRNNIHSSMNHKQILDIMYPSLSRQTSWFIEDKMKKILKNSIGKRNYKWARDKIFLRSIN